MRHTMALASNAATKQVRARRQRADRDRLDGMAGGAPVEVSLARHHARACGARGAVAHQVAFEPGALEDRPADVG